MSERLETPNFNCVAAKRYSVPHRILGITPVRLLKYKGVDNVSFAPTLRLQRLSVFQQFSKVSNLHLSFTRDLETF